MDYSFVVMLKQHIDLLVIFIGALSSGIYYGHNVLYKIGDLFKLILAVIEQLKELKAELKEVKDLYNKLNERVARVETSNQILMEK